MDDTIYEAADDVAVRCYIAYQKKFGKVNMVKFDREFDVVYLHMEGNDLYIAAANVGNSDKVTPVNTSSDDVLLPVTLHPNIEHVHLLKLPVIKLTADGHARCRGASVQLFIWNDTEWLDVNKLTHTDGLK